MRTILFLCTGNSCRSQIAEAYARELGGADLHVMSAGTQPRGLHPRAVQVMAEVGVDISGHTSKGLDEVPLNQDIEVVTLCGDARDRCPALPAGARAQHWDLDDPAKASGADEEVMAVFRRVRDEIRANVEVLLGLDRVPPAETFAAEPAPGDSIRSTRA